MSQRKILVGILAFVSLGCILTFYFDVPQKIDVKLANLHTDRSASLVSPKEVVVGNQVKVRYSVDYTIVLLGDSMTETLGNSDELRSYLKTSYPGKTFEVLNYGFGSTNILSAQERLEKETFHGRVFRPIIDIDYDLILIESFGHNPLSEYPLESGLKLQSQALDKIVNTVKSSNPDATLAFVATIAPNRKRYAEGTVSLSPQKRAEWADERISYIKNHIAYAQTHGIPLINIFDASLVGDNGGNLDYVSTTDFIHPSPTGVYFISKEIAKSIFENNLLKPQF